MAEAKESPAEDGNPRLEQLWSYSCDLTRGHSVSSMAWNKVNPVSAQIIPELGTNWARGNKILGVLGVLVCWEGSQRWIQSLLLAVFIHRLHFACTWLITALISPEFH